jgi:hypothetical protein
MSKVITFSRTFPKKHPKEGKPTYFLEKVQGSLYNLGYDLSEYIKYPETHMANNHWDEEPKNHTIRSGNRWKVGDKFSPRVWTGIPYKSKMYQFAPDVEIKKIWDIEINQWEFIINGKSFYKQHVSQWHVNIEQLAKNDGLSCGELYDWFKLPNNFKGQIICWNESINY